MKNETYEKAEGIKRKIRITEEIIKRLKNGAEPIVTITAIGGRLFRKEVEENMKIEREDMPTYIEMLEGWKETLENEFEEIQEEQNEILTVSPYEEYYNAGLSAVCPHCETQIAIPACDAIKVIECPVCLKDINLKWTNKEKKQCGNVK